MTEEQQQKSEALIIGLVITRQWQCDFCGKSLRNRFRVIFRKLLCDLGQVTKPSEPKFY